MRRILVLGLASAVILLLAGCAALFNGQTANVSATSEPSGAQVFVDGNLVGTTPIALQLSKKKEHTVTFKSAGHEDRTYTIGNHVRAGFIILDVLGGVIPVVIDAATGSWYGLNDKSVHGVLTPQQKSDLMRKLSPKLAWVEK